MLAIPLPYFRVTRFVVFFGFCIAFSDDRTRALWNDNIVSFQQESCLLREKKFIYIKYEKYEESGLEPCFRTYARSRSIRRRLLLRERLLAALFRA